jgi:hypothetical protein
MNEPATLTDENAVKALARNLFPEPWNGKQYVVPFLGAGASLPTAVAGDPTPEVTTSPDKPFPAKGQIETVLRDLGFPSLDQVGADKKKKRERLIVQFSIALAYLMIERARQLPDQPCELLQELINDPYPPSAGKLIDFFAQLSEHGWVEQAVTPLMRRWPVDWKEPADEATNVEWMRELSQSFKLLIEATSLWGANDPLTTAAAYYETLNPREKLWRQLFDIFKDKRTTTETHKLVAEAASYHLKRVRKDMQTARKRRVDTSGIISEGHYLVVTTNYDCLIEEALGKKVPWVVLYTKLTPTKQSDQAVPHQANTAKHRVCVRFSDHFRGIEGRLTDRHSNTFAQEFALQIDEPLVVIFKIHGSLHRDQEPKDDSLVITDFDYEDFLADMGPAGSLVVPGAVGDLMHDKSFLFMGYSLGDWNIRTILTALMRKRAEGEVGPDYAVMEQVSRSANAYCTRRKITILRATLDDFAKNIRANVPKTAVGGHGG